MSSVEPVPLSAMDCGANGAAQTSVGKQCSSFRIRANIMKEGLENAVPGITVKINPDKVTVEKNELKDETIALKAEMARLHSELQERVQCNNPTGTSIYLGPFHDQEQQTLPKPSLMQVKRPRARYPTPLDSWPMQILLRDRCGSNGSGFNGGAEGAGKA